MCRHSTPFSVEWLLYCYILPAFIIFSLYLLFAFTSIHTQHKFALIFLCVHLRRFLFVGALVCVWARQFRIACTVHFVWIVLSVCDLLSECVCMQYENVSVWHNGNSVLFSIISTFLHTMYLFSKHTKDKNSIFSISRLRVSSYIDSLNVCVSWMLQINSRIYERSTSTMWNTKERRVGRLLEEKYMNETWTSRRHTHCLKNNEKTPTTSALFSVAIFFCI